MSEITNDGEEVVKRWQRAIGSIASAKSQLNKAECELANATTALGKWLTPNDAVVGERFCVWYGDSLIEATFDTNDNYHVKERLKGRSLR